MIKIYKYKIKRDQGKELKIRLNNKIINKQFIDFQDGWNNFINL